MTRLLFTVATMFLATAGSAFAHHPMGGDVPATMLHGLLSGIGHPVIGLDHLAFVIAVGLIAAFQKNRVMTPASFVLGTMVGTMLSVSALAMPLVELVIMLSVVAAGVMVMRGKVAEMLPVMIVAGFIGLFHGWAYGQAVVGVETTPLVAYLAGIAIVQMVIVLAAGFAMREIWKVGSAAAMQPRLAGAVIAGVGLTYLVEAAESVIFPGV